MNKAPTPLLAVFHYCPATTDLYTLSYTTLFRSFAAAVLLLGERVSGVIIAGGILVLIGVVIAQYAPGAAPAAQITRSEEHTSELQSQSNLVCRLLLEKKKDRP